MHPSISTITLAVNNLDRSMRFYRDGLGLRTEGIVGTQFKGSASTPAGAVVMFELAGEMKLALYPATELAKDAGIDLATPTVGRFAIGHTVSSKQEVDAVLDEVRRAGGALLGRVGERPWGIYSGYFADPDGHLWEVLHFLAK